MGVVYRALDPRIGRTVAVKSIRLAEISDPSELKRLRDRLEREARSAGALSHRNIVTIYDIVEEEKLVHLLMEYVNGPSLDKMLSERRLPEKAGMLEFLTQIAGALDYAHKVGIIHRDVKPSNLMMHFDKGTGEQIAKITDFGVAKFVSQQMTQAGSMMGTPNYMAPEQIEGNPVSGQTDQFALAAVAYEILTGERPFVADYIPTLFFRIVREKPQSADSVNSMLDARIDAVLQKGLAKAAAERYENCSDFIAALKEACDAHPEWSPPYPMGALTPPPIDEAEPEMDAVSTVAASGATDFRNRSTMLDGAPKVPPAIPILPLAPPPAVDESTGPLPYELPPPRRRDWEEQPQPALPLWRKLAIAVLLCVMAGIAFVVYRNYVPGDDTVETEPAATASTPAASPTPEQTQRSESAAPAPRSTPSTDAPQPQAAPEQQAARPSPIADESAKQSLPPLRSAAGEQSLPGIPKPKSSPTTSLLVQFSSDPSNARVVVDHDQGKACLTPCGLPLMPGRHTLTVTAANYGIANRIIQVPDQRDVFVPLAQNIGIVQVDSIPSGSTVYVDDRLLGQTPTTLKLTAGSHLVRLVSGSRSHQETIEVNADSLQQFTFRWQ
jgi:serine/threonine-protein kinase